MSAPNLHRRWRSQSGLSLVELLVGLTIGAFILIAALSSLVLTRGSGAVIADSATLIAQGNHATRLIGFHLRQGGAIEIAPVDPAAPPGGRLYQFSDLFNGNDGTGRVVEGDEGGSAPDALTISYEVRSNEVTRDCLGAPTAAGLPRVQNRFFVDGDRLQCQGSGGGAAQPVADNVEDFQVWYWVQQGVAPALTLVRREAGQVVAAGGWANVVAVEICLQLMGDIQGLPAVAGASFLNCQDASTPQGGRQRQVLRSTLHIRNQGQ